MKSSLETEQDWDLIIQPKSSRFSFRLKEIYKRFDLLWMFVKRDISVVYKQTILGPLWFIIQPLLSTITFTFIFGNIAGISTDGLPAPLFYMSGIIAYNYFGEVLKKTSTSFIQNIQIFSKVYFPRLIVPISIAISTMVSFIVQLLFLFIIYGFYIFYFGLELKMNLTILLFPFLILIMALLALGFGIFIAALTTRYKDLIHLVGFGVQLIMYLSPVIYPLSTIGGKFKLFILLNPITPIIEAFRYSLFGHGEFSYIYLLYSLFFSLLLLFIALFLFNRVEKSFADTL